MSTVNSLHNSQPRGARNLPRPQPASWFGSLWDRWLKKRRRDRARQLSQVKFRLTREGLHFVGVLLFIFIGAVIRDINLLILLAGALIGLMLLQWRFNTATLLGLQIERRIPRSTNVGRETSVELRLWNSKSWLGAWLVVAEDPLQKELPHKRRLSERGLVLVDAVQPRGITPSVYQLAFHERGRYRVGPTTISTRFPLGLGRGWRTIDNESEIVVHPRLGELTSRLASLLQYDREGHAKASSNAGAHEGEFYGLRPWEAGDSRRWIHWRTTARLGALSVRQFERQQQRQICVLLDLYDSQDPDSAASGELAISFLATLANATLAGRRDKLAVAVAGKSVDVFTAVQSAVLVNNLMDKLAVVELGTAPDLLTAVRGLSIALLSNPYLLIISTRADQMPRLIEQAEDRVTQRMLTRGRSRWLDVSQDDLEPYFRWM